MDEDGNNLLDSIFNKTTLNYTLRVDNDVTSIDLSYIRPAGSTVTGDTGTLNLLSKINIFRVNVTAEDGVTKKVYTLNVYKTNDNNEVTDILVDEASLIDSVDSSPFIATRLNYNLGTVLYSKSTIKIEPTLADPSAKIWINGSLVTTSANVSLTEGLNTITVLVKSEYEHERNMAGLTYTLTVNRTLASSDTSITGINVNGISVNGYDTLDSDTIFLPSGTKFALIEVLGKHANATVLYDGNTSNNIILSGSTLKTVTVKVTAQNGDYKNYYVSVQAANTNNAIDNIILSGISSSLFSFDVNTKEYTIEVPFAINSTIVTVTTPTGAKSVVSGNGTYSLVSSNQYDNTIIVYATSESGVRGDMYTINIKREPASSDTNISALQIYKGSTATIGNELLDPLTFDPEDDLYEVRVNNDITAVFITATKATNETITGLGRKSIVMGTNIYSVQVTAEDGFSTRIINLKIVRANDNNTISSILVDGESKPTTPNGEIDEIVLNTSSNPYPFALKTINIAGVLEDASAKLFIDGAQTISLNHTLKEGQNTIVVYAVSEFGTKSREIHISYYRQSAATDTTLSSLSVELEDGTPLVFDDVVFDPSIENYVITLGDHDSYTKVIINALGEDLPFKEVTGQLGLQNLNWIGDSLNHKLNIIVTAENGSSRTYSVTFLKNSTLNSNTGINSLSVKDSSGKSYISFIDDNIANKGSITLPFSVSTLIFNIVTSDPSATVSWDNAVIGANTFAPGTTTIVYFKVTAQDGSEGTQYYFEVSREIAKTDQTLNTLSVKDKFGIEYISVFPNLNGTKIFNIRVNDNIDEVTVAGTVLTENKSRIVNGLGTYSLSSGLNTEIKVFVQAEDGTMDSPYIINVLRANNNAEISSVEIDGTSIDLTNFVLDNTSGRDIYVLQLDNVIFSKELLNIVVTSEDLKARVTGGGNVSLRQGTNSFTFFVTAQDGVTTSKEYRIDVFRESPSNNSSLSNLEFIIDGVDVLTDANTFNPTKTLYEVNVERGLSSGIITPTLGHIAQFVSGDINVVTINQGTISEYRIIVTAEDKVSVTTYVIKVSSFSTNNNILDINVVDNTSSLLDLSPIFDASTYIYTLDNVLYSNDRIKFNLVLEDSLYATYTVKFKNGNIVDPNNVTLNTGLNTFEIFATSENGIIGNVYEISITREAAEVNTHLNNITVRDSNEFGDILPNGNITVLYGKYDYTINLNASHTATSIYINAEAFSSSSKIISGLGIHPLSSEGATPIKITVEAESKDTQEYYVTIVKGGISPVSSDSDIYSVELLHNNIDYLDLEPSLLPTSMSLDLPNFVESVYLDITAHSKAQIIGNGVYNLIPGVPVVITYSVIAEDGLSTSQEYQLTVTRTARVENTLEDLFITVDGKKILIDPVQDINEVIVGMDVTEVTIGGVLPAGATTSGFKTYPINSNEEIIYLTVTSESGDDKIYSVKVIRKNSNTNITSIVIDGISYDLSDFNNKVLYLPNVTYTKNTINLLVTPEDDKANVIGNGVINLDPEHNAIKFRVEAEDKTLGDEYTIIVYRELISDDATLKDLFVEVGGVKILFNEVFNPNNLTYTLTISRGVSLYINAVKNHSNASIGGDYGSITIAEINQGGVTEFRIHVTAEDGVTKLIYRINVTAKNNVSEINDITVFNQDSVNLPLNVSFDSMVLSYLVNDVEYANEFISITSSFEDSYASLIVKNSNGTIVDPSSISLLVGSNVFTVYVLAEDGISTSSEYSITINRLAADTINTLTDLYVTRTNESGEVLSFVEGDFNQSINSYTIFLQKTDTLSNLYIHAVKESSKSTINGDKLRTITASDSNLLRIDVIGEDLTVNSYFITVIRGGSSDNTSDASVLEVNLLDKSMNNYLSSFNKNVAVQNPISVSYSVSSLFLLVSSYPNATVIGNGSYELTPGVPKTITFQVISEDLSNTSLLYSVTVTRENPVDDNYLDDLFIDVVDDLGNTVRIELDPTKLLNEVSINKNAESIIVDGSNSSGSIIKGLGEYTIDGNEKILKVIVSSPNSDDKEYIIRLHKASSDTDFSSIRINGVERLLDFSDRVLDLGNVNYSMKTLSVDVTAKDEFGLVNGDSRNYFIEYALTKTGLIEYHIFVLAEDGTVGPKYTIRLNRAAPNTNANLSSLTISDNETSTTLLLNPAFSSNVTKYTIDLTDLGNVRELLINGVKESITSTVSGNGAYILKTEQGQTSQIFNIIVTAEDGVTIKNYEILVTRDVTPEDDNTINEISLIGSDSINYLGLDGSSLYNFELSKYEYFISVPYEVKNVTLYISNNNGATPYGLGRHNITSKTTEIEFYMVSKSMIPSNTYKITIIRDDPSEDNLLSNIIIDGKTVTNFSPDVFEYTINVVAEKVNQISLDAVLNDPNALMTGDIGIIELPNGRTQLKINVRAESGDVKVYTINVDRLSGNNNINDISLNNGAINLSYQPDKLVYRTTVSYQTTSINVNALKEHSMATLEGTGLKTLNVGSNYFTVFATAENGDPGTYYQVEVVREAPSSDSSLKLLEIYEYENGPLVSFNPVFMPTTLTYNIALEEDAVLNSLFIKAEANSPYARGVSGTGFKWLRADVDGKYHNILEVTVLAEDGVTSTTYTINVYRDVDLSKDVTIGGLELIGSNGTNYLGTDNIAITNFNPSIYTYTITVPYNLASVTLNVATTSATVYGAGTKSFGASSSVTYEMYLVSQDSTVQTGTYFIVVEREAALTSNKLSSLLINEQDMLNFNPDVTQYEITLSVQKFTNILISATAEDSSAVISGDIGGHRLVEGTQSFVIVVTAQSGNNRTYTVIVNYVQSNALLEDILIYTSNNEEYIPDEATLFKGLSFDPETFEYTIKVDKMVKTFNISGAAQDLANALVIGFGTYDLEDTGTKINIFVQSADGKQLEKYVLNILKEDLPSNNSKLKDLKINNGEYKLTFDPNIRSYSITVKNDVTNLDVEAITDCPYAAVSITGSEQIDEGKNVLMVLVQAEDGSVSFYQVSVIRDSAPDYFLLVMLIVAFLVWVLTIIYFLIFSNRNKKGKNRPVVI
ncbi:MAG: cadherin-like beta sandwich domain-containing protein [Bacilli bacterium]